MNRRTIFLCSIGFLAAWTLLSIFGMIQLFAGFTDTYAAIVAENPVLANEDARQAILQGLILQTLGKWAAVAVPLGLVALWAKW
jgi:hypothetical protein